MTQNYLASVCIDASLKKVSSPPVNECSFVIPTLSSDESVGFAFEVVTIKVDCSVVFESRFADRTDLCPLISIPIMYVSKSSSALYGDMELEFIGIFDGVEVWRTRPFPGTDSSLVILSGFASSGECQLPECVWPSFEMTFPSLGASIVLHTDGKLVFPSGCVSFPHNVRYPIGTVCAKIRPGLPNRSFVYNLSHQNSIYPKGLDLFFPVGNGGVYVLRWDGSHALLGVEEFTTPILVSSLLFSAQKGTGTRQLVAQGGQPLVEAVANRISAIVFAYLSGESESKCLRRDRYWRQTGLKQHLT